MHMYFESGTPAFSQFSGIKTIRDHLKWYKEQLLTRGCVWLIYLCLLASVAVTSKSETLQESNSIGV